MKTEQVKVKSGTSVETALRPLLNLQPDLIIVYAPAKEFEQGGLVRTAMESLPRTALVIGCSTAGNISNDEIDDSDLVITASKFNKPNFKAVSTTIAGMDDSYRAGKQLVEKLDKNGMQALFVLGPGLDINGSAMINGIRDVVGPEVIITGGLAGDGTNFKKTYTLLNGEISPNQIAAFAIYGHDIKVAYGSMGGWEAFGPVRRVTKARQNMLFELDGEPALDLYKKYLGEAAAGLPASGLMYPFAILNDKDDSTGIIRTLLAVDETAKALIMAGDVPENGRVRLMHSTKKGLINGASGAAKMASEIAKGAKPDALGILISCVGRKIVLGSDVEEELEVVKSVFGEMPMTGFYSYGEICPQTGLKDCKLHNQTMTITYIYE